MRLLLYCGARHWGGAEIFLGHLISGFGADVQPTLLGVDADVLERDARRGAGAVVQGVSRVARGGVVWGLFGPRRAMAAAQPDIVQLNLPVPFAEPYSVLAALTV